MANETLTKLWDSLSPTADQPEAEAPSASPLVRLWNKLTGPSTEIVPPKKAKPSDLQFDQVFAKLINAESGGKQFDRQGNLLTSPVGAEGVTQVMPKTGKKPGFGVEPMKDKSRAEFERFGKDYLRAMLNEFDGDYAKALAAYNAGHGNVKKAVKEGGENWMNFLPKKEETIPYVQKILGRE